MANHTQVVDNLIYPGATLEDIEVLCETLVNDGIFYRIMDDADPRPRYGLTSLGERFCDALYMEPIGQA